MNLDRYWMPVFAPDGESGAPAAPAAPAGDTPVSGETSVPEDSSGGDEFSGLGVSEDDFTVELPPPPAAKPTPAATPAPANVPVAPAAPPAAAQPAQPAAPAQPPQPTPNAASTPQGTTPEAAPATAAPSEAASSPADPASLLKELEAHRDGVISALAQDPRFQLSNDEAVMLETDPGKAVPQLLARTYYQAIQAALTHINNFVPQMITRHMEGTRLQSERENAFYAKFPQLSREKHAPDVLTFARLFRQSNPNMALDDLFSMVGAAVMAKHGVGAVAASPTPPNGGRPPQPAVQTPPFTPAAAGAVVRSTPIEESPFAGLGRDWDE